MLIKDYRNISFFLIYYHYKDNIDKVGEIMVFKKPYAFFIKYFRLINMILVLLLGFLGYKLNLIRVIMDDIYRGTVTNYSSLSSTYIGFQMYLLIFIIALILSAIFLLLKRKNKPLKDYLFAVIYIFLIFIYLLFISNVFVTLDETIIEQTSLKLYTDIAFLIIIPLLYFVVKFFLIVIGFSLSKFNFTKDIIELKQEEKDNEEVEVIFDKNAYKYKRGIRKWFRELKYYFLENKFLIILITGIITVVFGITLFSFNIFNSNKVSVGENFNAGFYQYKVVDMYETEYDLNYNIVQDGSKFVIASVNVKNNGNEASSIDFKRIRLIYGDKYVYANNFFNKFFLDLGIPYNNEPVKSGELKNYIFIFKVPNTYKSSKYTLKFYDRLIVENEETVGSYKEINISADNLDKKRGEKNLTLNENTIFNKKNYGNSNLTISNYEVKSSYIYTDNNKTTIVRDKDINNILLILDYKLELDTKYDLTNYFSNSKEFFDKFSSIEYSYNGKEKIINNVSVLADVNNKVMLSVPYEIQNATSLLFVINFRDVKISFKLK